MIGRRGPRADHVVLTGRGEQADRRQHPGPRRDDDRRHAERVGQRAGVQRAGAAERDQREAARVDAPLDRHRPQRLLHGRVDHRDHAVRRDAGPIERRRAAAATSSRPSPGSSASAGMRPATRSASVTVGSTPAPAVAGGAGHRAGALRADDERAAGVEAGDRPAAGADGVDVERRQADGKAAHRALARRLGHAAEHEAHVGARAAHVERDRVREPAGRGDRRRRPHAAGRSGQQQRDRQVGADRDRHQAAGRRHHQHLVGEVVQRPKVRAAGRPEVGVDHGRDRALVLTELRRDLGRTATRRSPDASSARHGALVASDQVGVQQAHRDRVDVVGHARVARRRRAARLGAVGVEPTRRPRAGARGRPAAPAGRPGRRATAGPGGRSR